MKNQADYSLYTCPYEHLEKDCGHELNGPEGYENTYGVWCSCGFRGPVFYLDPKDLNLEKKTIKDPCSGCANTLESPPLFDCEACGKSKIT